MYTLYLQPLGEVTLYLDSIRISGFFVYMQGRDDANNIIDFTFDRLQFPDDTTYDFGYCHITEFIKCGTKTPCNIYRCLS